MHSIERWWAPLRRRNGDARRMATPPDKSGLESKLSPRLELIITATQPPPETTYVDLVLAKASPDTGAPGGKEILCFY